MINDQQIQNLLASDEPIHETISLPFVEDLPMPIPAGKLQDGSMLDTLQKLTAAIILADAVDDAQGLLKRLDQVKQLEKINPEIHEKYQTIIVLLKFVSLPTRKVEELKKLFRNHLAASLWVGIELKAKIAMLFLFYDETAGEGQIHRLLVDALNKNEEQIGGKPLRIPGENLPLSPTIKNWLRDYNQFTLRAHPPGSVLERSGVDRAAYITQNTNARGLSPVERKVLLRLLEFYDWMRLPSQIIPDISRTRIAPRVVPPTLPGPKTTPYAPRNLPPPPRPSREATEGTARPSRIEEKPTPSPPPPSHGGEKREEEDIYRSTLEELQKMRQEYEKKSSPPQNIPIPERNKPLVPKPGRGKDKDVEYRPYSVNEAIIRGGIQENNNRGEILPGDQEIEDKLKKLEDKLK